jgi:hypothetical protein
VTILTGNGTRSDFLVAVLAVEMIGDMQSGDRALFPNRIMTSCATLNRVSLPPDVFPTLVGVMTFRTFQSVIFGVDTVWEPYRFVDFSAIPFIINPDVVGNIDRREAPFLYKHQDRRNEKDRKEKDFS